MKPLSHNCPSHVFLAKIFSIILPEAVHRTLVEMGGMRIEA